MHSCPGAEGIDLRPSGDDHHGQGHRGGRNTRQEEPRSRGVCPERLGRLCLAGAGNWDGPEKGRERLRKEGEGGRNSKKGERLMQKQGM